MKHYIEITHVSNISPSKFEKELNVVISNYQNDGYFVEIQHGTVTNVFSAIVGAYVIKQSGDII